MTRPRVLVDGRKVRDFGIGSYIRGLLGGLARQERWDLCATVHPGDDVLLPAGVAPVACDARHYSVAELFSVRGAIARLARTVFHAPHYVVPVSPPAATVVTIHDLMHLSRPEHGVPWKRAYARWMVRRALRLSARVIAVSEATKEEVLAFGPEQGGKVENREYWGLRNLAYRIKKNRKGHYSLLAIDAPSPAVKEMERQLSINEDVLRFLTLRVEHLDLELSPVLARRDRDRERERRFDDVPA